MDVLKVGVVGCGAIGREHIKRLNNKLQGCTVTAVADIFEEAAQRGAALVGNNCTVYTDIKKIVNDANVDAIVVTTPPVVHKDVVLASILAGKPVFCEKPLASTSADCKAIVDAEVAAGKHLVQVGFMRRYDNGYRQVKDLLDSGNYGAPLILQCTHRNPEVGTDYVTQQAVFDTAIHEIDVLHWLIDDEYESAQVLFGRDTKYTHSKLRDPQILLLKTKGGVNIIIEVFVNCKFGYDINCEVICEDGTIRMPAPSFPIIRKDGRLSIAIEQSWINRFIDSYDVQLQDWVDAVKQGIVNGPNAWDGYIASVTSDALVKAQKTGKVEPITIETKPEFYIKQ
ncbi:MAG: Gfo/Idh/MocA family protein [Fastidiosipilaceae bacterium]|jgi:myo-inositol 2-dehydrogenase/D-chiro-inositol 1-dehydrogenase